MSIESEHVSIEPKKPKAPTAEELAVMRQLAEAARKEADRKKYLYESEALKTCREKYAHYLSVGNHKKASIYKAKIDGYTISTNRLKKLIGL